MAGSCESWVSGLTSQQPPQPPLVPPGAKNITGTFAQTPAPGVPQEGKAPQSSGLVLGTAPMLDSLPCSIPGNTGTGLDAVPTAGKRPEAPAARQQALGDLRTEPGTVLLLPWPTAPPEQPMQPPSTASRPTGQGSRLARHPRPGPHGAWASHQVLCGDAPESPRSRQHDRRPVSLPLAADTEAHSGFESLAPLRPPVEKVLCFRGPVRTLRPRDIRGHPHLRGLEDPALWDLHGAVELGAQLVSGPVGSKAAPASPALAGSGEQKPPASPSRGGFPKASERWGGAPLWQHSLYHAGMRPRASDGWSSKRSGRPRFGGASPDFSKAAIQHHIHTLLYAAPSSRFHSAGPGQPRTPTHQPVTT